MLEDLYIAHTAFKNPINTNVLLERYGCFHEKRGILDVFSACRMKLARNHEENAQYERVSEVPTEDISLQQS